MMNFGYGHAICSMLQRDKLIQDNRLGSGDYPFGFINPDFFFMTMTLQG
jgi:hypothetical protein